MIFEKTRILRSPRERVFQAFTEYEAVPKWQTFFKRVAVTKREGNTVYLDTDVNLMGRNVSRREKHVLTPPEQVVVEGEMQGTTNTTVWKFDQVPEGTKLTVRLDMHLPWKLRIVGPIVRRRFNGLFDNWLRELADYVEK